MMTRLFSIWLLLAVACYGVIWFFNSKERKVLIKVVTKFVIASLVAILLIVGLAFLNSFSGV